MLREKEISKVLGRAKADLKKKVRLGVQFGGGG